MVTADGMGMATERGRLEESVEGAEIGLGTCTVNTTMYPGSGISVEITPLLLPSYTVVIT